MTSLARNTDPETSHEAAAFAKRQLRASEACVLETLKYCGVVDDRELIELIGAQFSPSRIRGARCELARMKLIKHIGYVGTPRRRTWALA